MLEEGLICANLERQGLRSYTGEGPLDKEWWRTRQEGHLSKFLSEKWGHKLDEKEMFRCKSPHFNFYFFAEDIKAGRIIIPHYHLALFCEDNMNGEEILINFDALRKKPITTLGMLRLVLEEMSKGPEVSENYFNQVPDMFSKNKNYRPLYWFEHSGIFLD